MSGYTVGTRGSALALWQTRHVTSLLQKQGVEIAERIITTQGDVNLSDRLQGSLEKGFFTQELEAALRDEQIDWAVHSLKDLPTRMPEGLALGAVLTRAPPADLLLLREEAVDEGAPLPVKKGSKLGSSSLRREALIRKYAPGCEPLPLRGNVPTRVQKLRDGKYDGILLAEAGVTRLGLDLSGLAVFRLNPHRWPGAPGQGAVAVQCRAADEKVRGILKPLDHAPTNVATALERDFLRVLEGGCTMPFGCFIEDGQIYLGQAVKDGWHHLTVPVPTGAVPGDFIPGVLQRLAAASEEESNEWLHRRV